MSSLKKTIELRLTAEVEYVRAAVFAVSCGMVEADKLLAICDPKCIRQNHKAQGLYAAIKAIADRHEPISIATIYDWTHGQKEYGDIEMQDVANCIHHVAGFALTEEGILSMARSVAREGVLSYAEGPLMALVSQCQQFGADPVSVARTAAQVVEILEGASTESMADYSLGGIMQRVVAKLAMGVAAQPLPTPWHTLNRVLKGGLVPGELAILAARPGMGKTAMAGCLAVEVARAGKPVLFISREVKDETVAARMLARESRVDSRFFRQGIAEAPNILPRIQEAQAQLAALPLSIVERSVQEMTPREVLRLAKSMPGIGLIVVDYLQLMLPDTKQQSREREVADMSRAFKQMALDCDCPVLLLSQLNRASETAGRQPELSDLRESGAIEQDADIVMFLHADRRVVREARMLVKLIVAKGRSSGTGASWMEFNKPFADFMETDSKDSFPGFNRDSEDNGL